MGLNTDQHLKNVTDSQSFLRRFPQQFASVTRTLGCISQCILKSLPVCAKYTFSPGL